MTSGTGKIYVVDDDAAVGDSIEANFFDNPRRTDASLRFDPRSRQFAKHGDRERRRQPSFEPNP